MIQAARLAFGYGGIFDQDEAERIVEATAPKTGPVIKTGEAAVTVDTPEFDQFENEHLAQMREAAMNGEAALAEAFKALPKGQLKTLFWTKHQQALKAAAANAVVIDAETGEVQ
jgi:hypothetical protein